MIDFRLSRLGDLAAIYWLAAFASVVLYRRTWPSTSDVCASVTILKPLRREPIDGRKDHQAEKDEIDHRRFTARPGCTSPSTEAAAGAVLTVTLGHAKAATGDNYPATIHGCLPRAAVTSGVEPAGGMEGPNTHEAF